MSLFASFRPHRAAPQDFWILATISACMVGLALVLFTLTNPFSICSVARINSQEEEERGENSLYLTGHSAVNNSVQFQSTTGAHGVYKQNLFGIVLCSLFSL